MSFRIDLRSLDALASQLPFHIDDAQEVNDIYCSYRKHPQRATNILVELWTYCFIRRYFLIKFISESRFQSSELDQLVEKTYQKVDKSREGLVRSDRYAQWVSVICKNAYVNFVTRRKYVTTLVDDDDIPPEPAILPFADDVGALFLALSRAIDKLPIFLRNVARLRFVEDLSYEEISRITGKSVPTIRAYVHKICSRFRRDKGLASFKDWYK